MKNIVNIDTLDPLLGVGRNDPDAAVRIAALDAASRLPVTPDGWHEVAGVLHGEIFSATPGSGPRRDALDLAVRVPLLSVRRKLRSMAIDPQEPDAEAIARSLMRAGDVAMADRLLALIRSGRVELLEQLAAMPLEDTDITPGDIPLPPDDADPDTHLWYALAVARTGNYQPLDEILGGGGQQDFPMFRGNPWTPYNRIAAIRPLPGEMQRHLLDSLPAADRFRDYGLKSRIVWAATGIATAEGFPIEEEETEPPAEVGGQPPAEPSAAQINAAVEAAEDILDSAIIGVQVTENLVYLPRQRVAPFLQNIITKGNREAAALPAGAHELTALGNTILDIVSGLPVTDDWPAAELARTQLKTDRTALDDEQMAWVIARGQPYHVIRELTSGLTPDRPAEERRRILSLLGTAAEYYAGRGPSPGRGAGPGGGGAVYGRGPLLDDERFTLMKAVREPGEQIDREKKEAASQPEEQRRVNVQILHEGRRRNTFAAGSENVIRCWIGLPEPEGAAVSEETVPGVAIPPEGLPLTAVLQWNDQSDSVPLLLPAERTSRTRDCDLHITVPADERYVSAEIMFLYKGRVYEFVRVEAFVLAPGEVEEPHHEVRVRVQIQRREVIELEDRHTVDAVFVWGGNGAGAVGVNGRPSSVLHKYGGDRAGQYDLSDADAAVRWMNDELFAAGKSLIRKRGRQGEAGTGDILDENDEEVLGILRNLARHGTVLYNELVEQGFKDPGERIQLLNFLPKEYVPLEFVYDRGSPSDDATLCEGWLEALQSDAKECPVCRDVKISEDRRDSVDRICPLGFWSMQKIIERLDVTALAEEDPEGLTSVPSSGRKALPVIDNILFASSNKVSDIDRTETWEALLSSFTRPVWAKNWGEWKEALQESRPPLLLMLPHHGMESALDYLEIGGEPTASELRRLRRDQMTELYVNPSGTEPGPIVLLLGCLTGARTEVGYVRLVRHFQRLHSSIVMGTLAQILGQHAAPLARELVSQLVAVHDPEADFGTIMRRVRRRMLSRGYLMAFCLVALGDAEWRLTPRPSGEPDPVTGGIHVSN